MKHFSLFSAVVRHSSATIHLTIFSAVHFMSLAVDCLLLCYSGQVFLFVFVDLC